MPNKLPLFLVSSDDYGGEVEGVARALSKRFSTFRFGVGRKGTTSSEPFAPVVDFLKKSYPPPAKPKTSGATGPTGG